jgi:hypothetical protein
VKPALRVAAYRFRATLGHRWGGYLAIVLLVGLVGGLALGSIAAARRTESSFPIYFASTSPSDLVGATGLLNPTIANGSGYDPALIRAIGRLPDVKKVQSQSGIDFLPLQRNGAPLNAPKFYSPAAGNGYGSVDGLYFTQDKVSVAQGKMANPHRANQLMLSAQGASALHVHVGDVLPVGIYTNAQTLLPDFGTARVKPYRTIDEKVVGIAIFNTTIIQDQVDEESSPNNLFTPALTRQLLSCCVNYSESGVEVSGGAHNVAKVAAEISRVLPKGFPSFLGTDSVSSKAQRAIKPEVIALGAFGGIVALAALLIAGQLIGRQLRLSADERDVLRALGAPPVVTSSDGLIGIFGAVVLGALLAGAAAVALSPLAPLGPVRPVYPDPGVNFDWTVLGFGLLTLIVILGTLALVVGIRAAPHRALKRRVIDRPSPAVAAAARAGLPVPALTGIRFALESGSGQRSVPVRSAILGAALAVLAIVATVTFGASLDTLVSHPALYGWNWDYVLAAGADIPQHQATTLLNADRDISQWSGIYTAQLEIDSQSVPVLGERPGATVAPPLLSGHGVDTPSQIVLGALTLAQLHKHVGDTVEVRTGLAPARQLRIVGTAAMPTLGSNNGGQHLEMATGAILPYQLIPASDRNPFDNPLPGPNAVLIRLRPGVSRAAGLRSLNQIAKETTNTANFGVGVTGVLRPAEIVNYRSLGAIPVYLGAGLAVGAVAALALTLIASVRRKRRDLALLRAFGFTGRQLSATVAWQSTVAVVIGVVVGVPLGIALGRWLWDLFARDIHAVPAPTVPILWIVIIALGALVLANVVAAAPGIIAARTRTAMLLRTE